MFGVLDRYLLRETVLNWLGVGVILVFIIVVNRFALFLGEAAAGNLPGGAIFALLGLSLLSLLVLVIPVSLFLAIMLALGRLYRDSEITALQACGLSSWRLYRPLMLLGVVAAIVVGGLSLVGAPWAANRSHHLRSHAHSEAQVSILIPGRFKPISQGHGVFYAASVGSHGKILKRVFAEMQRGMKRVVLSGQRGKVVVNPTTGERRLELLDGYRYSGVPGQPNYEVTHFKKSDLLLRPPHATGRSHNLDLVSTSKLVDQPSAASRAELQWRLVQPFSALLLVLLAVPLAHSKPRRGRFSKLVPAVLIFLIYFNLLGVVRVWVADGTLAIWPGIWWVVLALAALALMLLLSQSRSGWFRGGLRG